ncbi:MAG: 30S ribosomal protein S7 [Patescibacteria group bacterium]
MPRRPYKKRPIEKDEIYGSLEVLKLINYIMLHGKKRVSEKIVYGVLEKIKNENKDPIKTLNQAISNVAPDHEVKPRRLGGASYLVPIQVRNNRKIYLALNWIVEKASAKSNKEFKTFGEKLYREIVDAANNQGDAVGKKLETERLAEANKAFSHLKW